MAEAQRAQAEAKRLGAVTARETARAESRAQLAAVAAQNAAEAAIAATARSAPLADARADRERVERARVAEAAAVKSSRSTMSSTERHLNAELLAKALEKQKLSGSKGC